LPDAPTESSKRFAAAPARAVYIFLPPANPVTSGVIDRNDTPRERTVAKTAIDNLLNTLISQATPLAGFFSNVAVAGSPLPPAAHLAVLQSVLDLLRQTSLDEIVVDGTAPSYSWSSPPRRSRLKGVKTLMRVDARPSVPCWRPRRRGRSRVATVRRRVGSLLHRSHGWRAREYQKPLDVARSGQL
jgi:hypothetical protein